ncbi:MAG: hypothetical protein LBM73_03800 [Candidatus Nomurabacteria bacterium]|nr:hypothetical protein [Candidatus Nomurabacteria bacterium]
MDKPNLDLAEITKRAIKTLTGRQLSQDEKSDKLYHMALAVLEKVPDFIRYDKLLDPNSHNGDVDRNRQKRAKRSLIEFNHILRDFISDGNIAATPMTNWNRFKYYLLTKTYGKELISDGALQRFDKRVHGVRHELAAKRLIESVSGASGKNGRWQIQYDDASVAQDRRGIDGKIVATSFKTGYTVSLPVNIKASKKAADRFDDCLWSGFTEADFGGYLLPPHRLLTDRLRNDMWQRIQALFLHNGIIL